MDPVSDPDLELDPHKEPFFRIPIPGSRSKTLLKIKNNATDLKIFLCLNNRISLVGFSVADPDPGSGAFLTLDSGTGIGFFRIPDPKPIFLRAW